MNDLQNGRRRIAFCLGIFLRPLVGPLHKMGHLLSGSTNSALPCFEKVFEFFKSSGACYHLALIMLQKLPEESVQCTALNMISTLVGAYEVSGDPLI